MPKLNDKEREQRRKKLQTEALESVMARGQFNFRLDGPDIKRLYELAGRQQKPVSAMVREWVLNCLEKEETNKYSTPPWVQELEQRLMHTEMLMALAALSSPQATASEKIRTKLRDHIMRHCNTERDSELRLLLLGQ